MRLCRSMTGPMLLAGLTAFLASACTVPKHSNTLVFGTNTMIALNATYDTTTQQGGITVGYKRQELVWMPLMVNKAAVVSKDEATQGVGSELFLASNTTDKGLKDVDALSVIANLGASHTTSVKPTEGAAAKGDISQFIATGFAARILAQKGGDRLVSTSTATEDSAKAELAAAKAFAAKAAKTPESVLSCLTKPGSDELDPALVRNFITEHKKFTALFDNVSTKTAVLKRLGTPEYDIYNPLFLNIANPCQGG